RAIGILPSFCWQTVQKISQAHNMETRAAQREKKEAQIQEKERQLEQIAAEERQLKEKERNAFLEQSSYKILLRDKDVENFNRILNDQRMNKQNKLLAANQREKHIAAQILAKDNGEMKPWYHSVEERIMNEDCNPEKEMTKVIGLRRIKEKQQEEEKNEKRAAMQKSILEANAEKVREKLEAKQIEKEKSKKRLGDLMEADRLHAAEIEQKKQQKQQDLLEYSNFNSEMAANKRALQMEKRKDSEETRAAQREKKEAQIQEKERQLEQIAAEERQLKEKILNDQRNEEASKFASSEKEMTKVIGLRRIKEKQQEEEKNEKRAAMQKSILEANAEKVREKLEAKQIEKEKSKKRLGDLMEADRLCAAEIEQKKQQKQQDLLEYSNFNSEMAANKRALQMEKRKGEIEEQK
uniref:Trichohyalin-plectin-homology domain-containing protein n=1 Tax=Poecilia formosa TaxID=48698 RepID=A0A096LTZ3_POEFO